MPENTKKSTIVLHLDLYEPTRDLSLDQKGMIYDAIFRYSLGEEHQISNQVAKMAFDYIRANLDRASRRYSEIVEKRKESGRLGGVAKAINATKNIANVASAKSAKQTLANLAIREDKIREEEREVGSSDSMVVQKELCF